jgi:PEGA domain
MRTSRTTPLLVAVALSLSVPAVAWSQTPPGADAAQQADEHFRQGRALFKAGKKREAREEYLAAFRLKQSHDVAGNLGNVELSLGMPRDAAEHLSFAIRHYAPSGTTPEQLERAKQRLAEAKQQIGTVTVSVSVPGAEVLVDGVSIGRAPLEGDVFVEPGTRTFSARLALHDDATQTIEVGKGTERSVALTVVPTAQVPPQVSGPAAAGAPAVVPSVTPPAPPVRRSVVPGVVLGVVGGAVFLTGAGLAAGYAAKKSDADSLNADITAAGGYCNAPAGSVASQCSQLHAATSQAATFGRAGIGMLIGGAAVLAASGGYLLWPESKAIPPTGMRAAPVALPGGGGVLVQGSF